MEDLQTPDPMLERRDHPRLAITGIGVVSAIGCGRQAFWNALNDGRSGVAPLNRVERAEGMPKLAAAVRDFAARDFVFSPHLRRMDKLSRMIVAASRMALQDGCVDDTQIASERLGIVAGSAFGNISESVLHIERLFSKGPSSVSPMMFPNMVPNAPASYVGMELGATGVNLTVSQLEVSGEHAIILGADLVRTGRADLVVAGGGDELGTIVIDVYKQARALSSQHGGPEWSSPYDANRNGVVLGEGAAMLVIEPAERAIARGASAYAEIEGDTIFSVPSPIYDWGARVDEALQPLRTLLASAGASNGVDLICGAANSSRRLDRFEMDLFAALCGETASQTWLTSVKGATGEFGASGALTAAAAALALREQVVPPLCNLRRPESNAPFRFAAGTGMPNRLERVLLSSIVRGGSGAALCLHRVATER